MIYRATVAVLLACSVPACSTRTAAPSNTTYDWVDGRTVDTENRFATVGASIVDVGPNDAGLPVGILAFCSATLIHERVFVTAGHCIGQALAGKLGETRIGSAQTIPPAVRLYVTLSPNALDRYEWIPVERVAGHPSLPLCPNRRCDWDQAPIRGLSDVGLLFLRRPVLGVTPTPLAAAGTLANSGLMRSPMPIVGYGLLQEIPEAKRATAWDGLRRVRHKRLTQVIDETWATWSLPGELCNGDSGGPVFVGDEMAPETLHIVAVVSYVGPQCRPASIHARLDTPAVQRWIVETIARELPPRGPP
jgi:hypothetical protein